MTKSSAKKIREDGCTEMPLVSIITAVFNGERYLGNCIESVLKQNYPNIQYIIVDGGSNDGTLDILKIYDKSIDIWISEPDTGIYNAINKGILLSKGEYYVVLGSDDTLLPYAIDTLINRIESKFIVSGKANLIDENNIYKACIYAHSGGTLIKKSAHDMFGLYDETYMIAADTKFMQMVNKHGGLLKINEVVANFRAGGKSSSYRKTIKEHARAMQESGAWGQIRSFLWLSTRILYSYIKK